MFLTLVRKEIVSHILTLRFAVTFALSLLFITAGFYVSVAEYKRSVADGHATERLAKYAADELDKVPDNEERMWRMYWSQGAVSPVPVPPLASVAQGLSGVWPAAVSVSMQSTFNLARGTVWNPLSRIFQLPDYVYIVNAILSLLAILFIFDGVCGEKESGTLRLMLSFSVPRSTVLLSKWVGGYIALLTPFIIGSLAGLGYAWTQGVLPLGGGNLLLIILIAFIAALYISVFFTLGLFISTVTKRAFTSLFVCLFVWVMFILIIPNLAPIMGRILSPTPSARKIEAEKDAVSREIQIRAERLYWVNSAGSGTSGDNTEQEYQKLREEEMYRRNRWDRFLEQAQLRQAGISETLGRFSPSACWIFSAFSLNKTGPAAYRNIIDGRNRLKMDVQNGWRKVEQYWEKNGSPPDVKSSDLPALRIQFYDTSKAVAGALNDVLLLAVYNVLFFMCAFLFFLRYDVR
jgi:ABC-type transport system involved in multi-copper enzyme maturation permease subunit